LSGVASAIFVVSANAWMNAPQGFSSLSPAADIDPVRAMFNRAWLHESIHMVLAAFEAVGFAVAGIHAWLLLRGRNLDLNRRALHIALSVGSVAALLQPLSGDFAAKRVATLQPQKLAAMEALFLTQARAPLAIGGLPDPQTETLRGAIEIPGALSFLAFGRFDATVRGLRDFPRDTWPPVVPTHIAFQIMVGCGMLLAGVALLFGFYALRRRALPRPLLWIIALCTPLGFVALEAGWVVTEVGRQPWIIYGLLRTKDAVTPIPGLHYHLILFLSLYALLAVLVLGLLRRLIRAANAVAEPASDAT
jgi:cytochrome d ubiquinol oxidase subunit I